jgi:2-polyprenyl-3-methyl-5-hydroxy-6-metoxy-1,4-benzoquinol methylase
MFKRRVETDQEEALMGLEAAKEYAEIAQKSTMRYRAFLNNIKSLSIKGRYLDVGAGPGIQAGMIVQNNPDVEITALEVSADMVAVGEDYLKSKGLQDRIQFVIGDAADKGLIKGLGKFDLVYSAYSLHHWKNPRKIVDNCMKGVADNGFLFIHDLRRVWWLYWIPIKNGLFNSIRAAYVRREIEEMLGGFNPECYEVNNEFPFMHSVIIRKST